MEDGIDTQDIEAFGYHFRGVDSESARDLSSLEKEGVIYANFWDEPTQEFLYYRIALTPSEIFRYVEAEIARNQFDQLENEGESFDQALKMAPPSIAERVRSYGDYGRTRLRTGEVVDIRGCPASFWPPEIESLLCGGRPERYELLPRMLEQREQLGLAVAVVNALPHQIRYLAERGHGRPPFLVETEYDVQDLLFVSLRGYFRDTRREEWTPKLAGASKRVDLLIPSIKVLVEVKYVRSRSHGMRVADELRVDFESYHAHRGCSNLLAVVYDPQKHILDQAQFRDDLSGSRTKGDHSFEVQVFVF